MSIGGGDTGVKREIGMQRCHWLTTLMPSTGVCWGGGGGEGEHACGVREAGGVGRSVGWLAALLVCTPHNGMYGTLRGSCGSGMLKVKVGGSKGVLRGRAALRRGQGCKHKQQLAVSSGCTQNT